MPASHPPRHLGSLPAASSPRGHPVRSPVRSAAPVGWFAVAAPVAWFAAPAGVASAAWPLLLLGSPLHLVPALHLVAALTLVPPNPVAPLLPLLLIRSPLLLFSSALHLVPAPGSSLAPLALAHVAALHLHLLPGSS
jgi:hypothetical protein